jgi:hypothetical protein
MVDKWKGVYKAWDKIEAWMGQQYDIDGDFIQVDEILKELVDESKEKIQGIRVREEFRKLALVKYPKKTVQEYIDEAEHGDGYGYWLMGGDAQSFVDDLDLYVANMG